MSVAEARALLASASEELGTTEVTAALIIGLVSLVALWLVKWLVWRCRITRAVRGLPKPPGSLPIFGHALELGKGAPWDTILKWVRQCGDEDRQGNAIVIDFLMQTGVVLTDPRHIRHVMGTRLSNYPKDLKLAYSSFLHLLGTGLVTSDGAHWKKQRDLLSKALRVEILEETADVAKRAADRLSARLEMHRNTGRPVEMAEEFRVMTLQVIGELILSLSPEESERVFPELYLPIVMEANRRVWEPWRAYMPTPANLRYHRTVASLNSYVSNLIRERWAEHRRAGGVENVGRKLDILDRVLSAVDPKAWGDETVRQLRDEIKTFLLAGHETSASMLAWTVYQLSLNPEARQRVLDEGASVFKNGARGTATDETDQFQAVPLPSRDELNRLEYTVCALKESLRMYSLVPMVTRECLKDDVIAPKSDVPIKVPAGAKIFINIKTTHLNPKLWPDPEKYEPERFSTELPDMYNFNAFTNGPRNCLGQHLALLEARIVLSLLSQRFTFHPANERVGDIHQFIVPTCPANGMDLLVT